MDNYYHQQENEEHLLKRLLYYTKRARRLRYYEENDPSGEDANVQRLHRLCRGKPLFPCLRKLQSLVWPLSIAEANILLSPTLRGVDIGSMYAIPRTLCFKLAQVQQEQMCLQFLVKRCPDLRVFNCWKRMSSSRLLDPVFNLSQLESIECHILQPTIPDRRGQWLEKASWMRRLIELRFFALNLPDSLPLNMGPFTRLELLEIIGSTPVLFSMFRSMCSNHLRSVSIRTDIGRQVGDWYSMKKCLQSLVDGSGERITQFYLDPNSLHDPLAVPPSSMFLPLAQARNMQQFTVNIPCVLQYDDIAIFAHAWPNLRSFGFSPSQTLVLRQGFDALIVLARSCPRLERIEICLDLSNPPTHDRSLTPNHSVSHLELSIPYLPPADEDIREIAEHIHRLFPAMSTWFHPFEAAKNWSRVLAAVKELKRQSKECISEADTETDKYQKL